MTNTTEEARATRRARHDAILAEVSQEEAEAGELDVQLRRQAAVEQIPTSALVRRLIRQAVYEYRPGRLTAAEVEDIARRLAWEELHDR